MFDLYFICFLFIFSLSCFFDIIVFNEEVLLTLCFLSFIFFIFNNLGATVSDTFLSRAAQHEKDLITSFKNKHNVILLSFNASLISKNSFVKFSFLEAFLSFFLTTFSNSLKSIFLIFIKNIANSGLLELAVSERRFIETTQQSCANTFLYPLIFLQRPQALREFYKNFSTLKNKKGFDINHYDKLVDASVFTR